MAQQQHLVHQPQQTSVEDASRSAMPPGTSGGESPSPAGSNYTTASEGGQGTTSVSTEAGAPHQQQISSEPPQGKNTIMPFFTKERPSMVQIFLDESRFLVGAKPVCNKTKIAPVVQHFGIHIKFIVFISMSRNRMTHSQYTMPKMRHKVHNFYLLTSIVYGGLKWKVYQLSNEDFLPKLEVFD